MEVLEIKAKQRKETGGGSARQMRAQDLIPVVVYGNHKDPEHVSVDTHEFHKRMQEIKGENVMIDLKIEGSKETNRVFLREIQRDPVHGDILHMDFLRIDPTHKMHFQVPIHYNGDPLGVKQGGVLDTHRRYLEVNCLPENLPPHFDVDISELEINQALHVSDMDLPEDLEILTEPDEVIISILPPRKLELPTAEEGEEVEGEEVAEPELIGEEKEEGEEESPEE